LNETLNQSNKQRVWEFWQAMHSADGRTQDAAAAEYLSTNSAWHGPDPINDLTGVAEIMGGFWRPLQYSFPDIERETFVFFGGASSGRVDGTDDGRMWVGGTGVFNATFENDYLTIPASKREVRIRWGEFCRLENEKIVETFIILDLIDLMQQAGFEVLPPSRGADRVYPPPRANDGMLLEQQDAEQSANSLQHIRRFIFDALNSYDHTELKSMGIADYFHPDVRWYGPGGIGACFGLREFEEMHQKPWLHAFPDRRVQNLDALIAEGPYSGGPGWAGVKATHTGKYLDVPATSRPIEINGFDIWKRENDVYTENWVFVDMVHLYRQFGIDLLERRSTL
jgi:predicted ester cyclase